MTTHARHRGTVLIVTMIVIFALASLVVVLGQGVRVEAVASANAAAAYEADAVARGAEQYVLALLTQQRFTLHELTEEDFAAVPVGNGLFWIIRPDYGDDWLPTYGLVDESSKLSLNDAAVDVLNRLPGMTDEIAAAIVDWHDEDDQATENGAESAAYLSQTDGYNAKNADFETVEELLMVRGMTRELLYGQRYTAATTINGSTASSTFNSDRYITEGLFDYFTVWSSSPNVAADGAQRVNINSQPQRDELATRLSAELGSTRGNEVMRQLRQQPMTDIFDMADRANLKASELALIEDYITTEQSDQPVVGRVNINTAPPEVVYCIEGLDTANADRLLTRRTTAAKDTPNSIAWVWDELDQGAIGLGNQITGYGRQFSADIVAVSGDGRAFRRIRIVVDASETMPRIVYRRDLTDRGWPMDSNLLAAIRAGDGATVSAFTDNSNSVRSSLQ